MHILLVDAAPSMGTLASRLRGAGHTVELAADLARARGRLAEADFDAVVCDPHVLAGNGLLALHGSHGAPALPVVVVTDEAHADGAIESMRAHALAPVTAMNDEDEPKPIGQIAAPPGSLRAQLRRFEAQLILRALEDADGDRRLAAQRLHIGLSSLYRKIEELDIRERARAAH
jgi:DNA-binding NtrC family response regulator